MSRTAFGQPLEPGPQGLADPGGVAVGPGGFDQGPAGASIAGERQARAPDRVAGRALPRNQAEERHQLGRRVEAAHIADLGREGHRDQEGGAAHRLVGLDDRRHGPGRHDRGELLVQAMQPLSGILDRVDLLLEDDLLGRVLEGLTGKPAPVRQRPMTAAVVDPAMAQEKGEQLLAFAAQVVRSGLPGPDQIADGLMDHVRNPDPTD